MLPRIRRHLLKVLHTHTHQHNGLKWWLMVPIIRIMELQLGLEVVAIDEQISRNLNYLWPLFYKGLYQ